MESISCTHCTTSSCFIKQYCSFDWLKQIDEKKFQVPYKQNQNIITEISPVLGMFFIQSGKAKIFSSGISGKKQIVRLVKEGHIIGHMGGKNDTYPVSAVAMADTTVCFIENPTLRTMFKENPDFTIEMMMYYSRELRKMENRLKNIAQMNIREKIAEAITLLCEIFGMNRSKELLVEINRDDLASIAGTNAEQVSRQISAFEEEKLIERRGKKIALLRYDKIKDIIKHYNQVVVNQ